MLFLNLFTGVLFFQFSLAQKRGHLSFLTQNQQHWIRIQKKIVRLRPQKASVVDTSKSRKGLIKFTHSRLFEVINFIVILGSLVIMALDYDDSPHSYEDMLKRIDIGFSLVFLLEAILKILAMKFSGYFSDPWNKFDFFVMLLGVIGNIIENFFNDSVKVFNVGPKVLRSLRMVRIVRILRILKRFKNMVTLIQTLVISLPMILNIFALLMLIFFCYAVLGSFLYSEVKQEGIIDDYVNFKNFAFAMLTLFKMSTGDEWSLIFSQLAKDNCKLKFLKNNID
jgi:hypothetical protein